MPKAKPADKKQTPPEKQFAIAGGLSLRLTPEEGAHIVSIHKILSTPEKPIASHKEFLIALADAFLKLKEGAPGYNTEDLEALQELQELRDANRQLTLDLENYSSIDITQMATDTENTKNANNELSRQLVALEEEFTAFRNEAEKLNTEHSDQFIYIDRKDPRLLVFFRGANARLKAGKVNNSGRPTKDITDVLQDLAEFAATFAHRSELFKG